MLWRYVCVKCTWHFVHGTWYIAVKSHNPTLATILGPLQVYYTFRFNNFASKFIIHLGSLRRLFSPHGHSSNGDFYLFLCLFFILLIQYILTEVTTPPFPFKKKKGSGFLGMIGMPPLIGNPSRHFKMK